MVLRGVVGVLFAVVALTGAARESRAQPIMVTDNTRPLAGAQVSAMINGIKTPLGTTNASGQITIDPNDLNITKGTEVHVHWIKSCEDGTVQVILVPPGQQSECAAQDAQAGERCGCRRHPAPIIWGDGPVTIDIGTGSVTQIRTRRGYSIGNSLVLGPALDVRYMYNLGDRAAEAPGATGASATTWSPGLELLAELQLLSWLVFGIDGSYATMDGDVTFPEGNQTFDIRYYELGGNLKVGRNRGVVRPYLTVGIFYTWNKADFELDGESEYRLHKTRRDGIGAGLDYYPRPNVGFRIEGLYNSTFEDNDADEHIRWKFGLLFRPFIRGRGVQ